MNTHQLAVTQPKKMLNNLAAWLDKAAAHAEEKKFDANILLSTRLAPDQFSLVRQIQSACDTAKFIPARLGGGAAPKNEDTEQTLDEIRARIGATVAYLDSIEASSLDGALERKVTLPFLPEGQWVRGEDYLIEFALPNFYFHLTTAYAILRHCGVDLGKRDFLASMTLQGG